MDDKLTQLRRGALELAVLALLETRPMYGAEIVELLADHRGLDAPSGTVYPLLTRLRTAGTLETTWQESPVGPPRRYYALTPAGRREFATQLQAWRILVAAMGGLLPKEAAR